MFLVTGCTGYVGSHVVKALLEANQPVRGSVRSISNTTKYQFLLDLASNLNAQFEVCALDLSTSTEEDWDKAVMGCVCVLHVAAGTSWATKTPQKDLVDPTVHGTNQMLQACKRAGIKHIVLTSSISAVSFNFRDKPVFTSEHWNDLASPQRQPYPYCKVLSERMCRDFCREHSIALCVILPANILGPPMTTECNGTLEEGFMGIVNGTVPIALNIPSPNCDVRDVAAMHRIAAMDATIQGRYFCWSDTWTQHQAHVAIFNALPQEYAKKRMPRLVPIPNTVMRLVLRLSQPKSLVDIVGQYLGSMPQFDVAPALKDFKLEAFTPMQQTLEDTARWAWENGHVNKI